MTAEIQTFDNQWQALSDPNLLCMQAYINGQFLDADDQSVMEVTNPANGEVIATIPNMKGAETERAIDAANKAWPAWRKKTARERANILRKWYELICEHVDDLAYILTMEQGKPLAQAKGEILNGAGFVEWFAEEGRRIYGDIIPTHQENHRLMVLKQPIGVAAAITPWNFPSSMITRKASAALAAGCPIILKPSELTPLSALALAELATRAGIPAGIFNVVTGDAVQIGNALCESDVVRKLSFTGSTPIGKLLMSQSADTLKKLSLELGGNAPFIVFDDADLDAAVAGAIASKYRNSGQTCICANRIFVQEGIYDDFMSAFVKAVKEMKIANGMTNDSDIGPMINQAGVDKATEMVTDALAKGGELLCGADDFDDLGALFMAPHIISNATTEMACFKSEIFGPVAPIFKFKTEDDVIAMANDTEYGLAAYVYCKDLARTMRMGEELEYGMIGLNSALLSTEQAPFGGIKQSGMGREGSKYGVEDYLEVKFLCLGGV